MDDETLEAMTDAALRLLLDERAFLDDWEERIYTRLEERRINKEYTKPTNAVPDVPRQAMYHAIRELLHSTETATKSFMTQVDYAVCHNDPEGNRDVGILFEAGLRVERAVSELDMTLLGPQIGSACRRLANIFRLFTTRISSSRRIQLEGTYQTAARICDLSYSTAKQFDRYIKNYMLGSKEMSNLLRTLLEAIDAFNVIVVEKLCDMAAKFGRRKTASPVQKSLAENFQSPTTRALRIERAVAAASPANGLSRFNSSNRGYLLDPALSKARARIFSATVGASNARISTQRSRSAVALRKTKKVDLHVEDENLEPKEENRLRKSKSVHAKTQRVLEQHKMRNCLNDHKRDDVGGDFKEDVLFKTAQTMSREIINDMRKLAGGQPFLSIID